jgi:chaperone BCS1
MFFGVYDIDTQLKVIPGNILNMFIFDKFKTGKPIIDSFVTTLILMVITYFINFLNNNISYLIKIITSFDYEFESIIYNKNLVEYEGNIALTTTYYDNNLNQTNSFSDRFKAIWINIIDNINENETINHIKEYSFDNYSKNNKRDFGIYMVIQKKKFLISKKYEIYAYTSIWDDDKDDDNKSKNQNKKKISKIEKINIKLFSYKSDINTIKEFVENITKEYLSSIENLRENQRFIYTLTKTKYEESRYEIWDETKFSSTRRFNNIFFKDKTNLINKLDLFLNNKDWYFTKGIPYSIGIGMYGPPGTGKTSLIKAIANYTDRHIIVISLKLIKTKKQLDSIFFEERYNSDNKKDSIGFDKKVIVFEDIDCIGDLVLNRERQKNKSINGLGNKIELDDLNNISKINIGNILDTIISTDKTAEINPMCKILLEDEPLTLDDILNLWDGIRETPGRIMVISSNHYFDLDPALIRPGRIDVTLNLSYVSHKIIQEMYAHLFDETIENNDLKNIKEDFYSPAEIINIYMNEDRIKERFINRLCKNEHV